MGHVYAPLRPARTGPRGPPPPPRRKKTDLPFPPGKQARRGFPPGKPRASTCPTARRPGNSPARQAARFPPYAAKRPLLPFLPEKQAHRAVSRPTGRALPPVPPQNRPGEFARPAGRALSPHAAKGPFFPFFPKNRPEGAFPPGKLRASACNPQTGPGIRPSGRPRAFPTRRKKPEEFARPVSRALSPLAAKRPALPLARRGGPLGASLALRRAKGRAVFV